MKKLKTWEMIKELTESTDKIFKCLPYEKENVTLSYEKTMLTLRKNGHEIDLKNITLWDEWEEAKQPVPWQEAIEAWSKGRKIYCITDSKTFNYDIYETLTDSTYGMGVSIVEISTGKWYIEGR